MVKLLQSASPANASIANSRVIQGVIDLDYNRLRNYFGINNSTDCDMANYANRILTAGGVPKTLVGPTTCFTNIYVIHFWLKVTLSGVNYEFDPSLNSYDYTANIDPLNATGFDLIQLLNSASASAVITPDYVQNINRANIRASLNSYTNNLINWIRANKPSADINDIIGGRVIRPVYDTAINVSLPYLRLGAVPVDIGPRVPDALRPTLRVRFKKSAEAAFPIDRTFFLTILQEKG